MTDAVIVFTARTGLAGIRPDTTVSGSRLVGHALIEGKRRGVK
jgi:hypothetical protein